MHNRQHRLYLRILCPFRCCLRVLFLRHVVLCYVVLYPACFQSYRAFHNVLRDYKNLLQENHRTRIYETCADRRKNSNPPPVSCFSSQFTFLLLGDASVCSEKMAAPREKSFCMLEYHTSKSVVTATCISCKVRKEPAYRQDHSCVV